MIFSQNKLLGLERSVEELGNELKSLKCLLERLEGNLDSHNQEILSKINGLAIDNTKLLESRDFLVNSVSDKESEKNDLVKEIEDLKTEKLKLEMQISTLKTKVNNLKKSESDMKSQSNETVADIRNMLAEQDKSMEELMSFIFSEVK